ncbi:MAG: glycosyltransferase family 2 protein [Bacteroides sp.]|nr:glycosyltransferase family 2 protein [Bacteroides sp.]
MNTDPLVAIVIPAYKPDFLRSTLESIAAQTDRRFHVFIGDDASPHDIASIAAEFEGRLPLTYHRFADNLGSTDLVGQWHRCIGLTGDIPYIWLFSDDDVMGSECIRDFLSLPKRVRDESVLRFSLRIIDAEGRHIEDAPSYPLRVTPAEYLKGKLEGGLTSYVVEFIFPRRVYDAVGGFENFDLAWGSDFMTWIKMANATANGIITIGGPETFVAWRRSDLNISPDVSHPVVVRKCRALIENAVFLQRFMKNHPEEFRSIGGARFRWVRFPLGELVRRRRILGYKDILRLSKEYSQKVGYPFISFPIGFSVTILKRLGK